MSTVVFQSMKSAFAAALLCGAISPAWSQAGDTTIVVYQVSGACGNGLVVVPQAADPRASIGQFNEVSRTLVSKAAAAQIASSPEAAKAALKERQREFAPNCQDLLNKSNR